MSSERKKPLSTVVKRIEETQDLYYEYQSAEDRDDYSQPVYKASIVCEILVSEVLRSGGVEVRDHRVIMKNDDGSGKSGKWVVSFLMDKELSALPDEYAEFFGIIYRFRKEIKEGKSISRESMNEFMHVYECFLVWFYINYRITELFSCKEDDIVKLTEIFKKMLEDIDKLDGEHDIASIDPVSLFNLSTLSVSSIGILGGAMAMGVASPLSIIPLLTSAGLSLVKKKRDRKAAHEKLLKYELDILNIAKDPKTQIESLSGTAAAKSPLQHAGADGSDMSDKEQLQASMKTIVEEATSKLLAAISDESKDIKGKLDDISAVLDSLMKQINQFQMMVQNQIDIAVSDEEIDRIVHVYSDTCVNKIVSEIDKKYSDKARIEEEAKLISSLEGAWDKLSNESKNYLVSAKVTYSYYINVNSLDYSGVCLLVTKALELEMSRRFYTDYVTFLKKGYEDSWKNHLDDFPTTLIKEIGGSRKLKSVKDFTLGSVPYVLCYTPDPHADGAHQQNNEDKLIRFVRSGLMDPGLSDREIMEKLRYYGETIEDITKKYRNKAAHTNELKRVDADECFELVIDVEKLLKVILDSFNY